MNCFLSSWPSGQSFMKPLYHLFNSFLSKCVHSTKWVNCSGGIPLLPVLPILISLKSSKQFVIDLNKIYTATTINLRNEWWFLCIITDLKMILMIKEFGVWFGIKQINYLSKNRKNASRPWELNLLRSLVQTAKKRWKFPISNSI